VFLRNKGNRGSLESYSFLAPKRLFNIQPARILRDGMRTKWLLVSTIPVIFAVGIVAFFALIPPESLTLNNFIAYMSSLSTAVMVLVYIITTSATEHNAESIIRNAGYQKSSDSASDFPYGHRIPNPLPKLLGISCRQLSKDALGLCPRIHRQSGKSWE
jgi:hypothetical protein